MRRSRGTIVLGLAAVATFALASATDAAGPAAKIKASKHEDGPYSGGTITDHMSVGETQDYYFKVVNKRDTRQELNLNSGVPPEPEYERTWFKGNRDVTDEIASGPGYNFEIGQKAKIFRVRVEKNSNGGNQCIDAHLVKGMHQIDVSLVAIDDDSGCF
jgi:hypothetical protein